MEYTPQSSGIYLKFLVTRMLIGQLSKKTGLSKDTIRFYEKIGLITATDKQAGTRIYKEYDEEMVERLSMINQGKGLGFTLGEMKQLLDEWGNGSIPKSEQIRIIERKLEEVAQKMQQLHQVENYLINKLGKLKDHDLQ
ncbi:MAG: MerR family DNA-binding protein [Calothrix sp. FI2-JRJ7]|jgi:MerR family Zn(II)-responsive transcriptional regulator of zntA|nr:MerR family DNA-binding protein [Calothrix sp. FI2-JRJ7]